MDTAKPTIIVTGVSGNLGQRLVQQLSEYTVVGIDIMPPTHSPIDRFVALDLGREESTRELLLLLRELRPASVVHLAFVIDPQRSGILDVDRMWRIKQRVYAGLTYHYGRPEKKEKEKPLQYEDQP